MSIIYFICSKLHDLEAELCKVESKYFILLKESQEPELREWVWPEGVWL